MIQPVFRKPYYPQLDIPALESLAQERFQEWGVSPENSSVYNFLGQMKHLNRDLFHIIVYRDPSSINQEHFELMFEELCNLEEAYHTSTLH